MKKQILAAPYLIWMIIFIVVPLVLIIGYSVITVNNNGVFQLDFSNITKCFEPIYMRIIGFSFMTALFSTVLCFLLGYPMALILAGKTFKRKNTLLFLILAPMWMNFLLRTYAWLTILEKNGIINKFLGLFGIEPLHLIYTTGSVMLGMVHNFLPFMILPIYSVVTKIDNSLIEAANDLGASKFDIFKKITFPLSLPGVFSGIIMVFMPAVTTFVITRLLGGGHNEMIGNVIEQQFIVSGDWAFGSSLSVLLMIIILICTAITNKYDLEEGGGLF